MAVLKQHRTGQSGLHPGKPSLFLGVVSSFSRLLPLWISDAGGWVQAVSFAA